MVFSTILQRAKLENEIKTKTEPINANTTTIDNLVAYITDVTEKVDGQARTLANYISETLQKKVQVSFTEAVGRKQVK